MVFPANLGPVNEEDVENYLVKLTKRLIKDVTKEYGYILEHVDVPKERKGLLVQYNELRNELHTIIFNVKCAMERLPAENFIQNTLKAILEEIESSSYLVIHPSLTFNTGTLVCIANKTMNTIHTNFLRLVDLTESQELKGDNKTRREIVALMDDFLVVLERTKLHSPTVNVYDEDMISSVARTESIKQINFSEEYQKTFFFETIRVVFQSLQDIIDHFHRSMYGYNETTREFLMYCAVKLNKGLVDFEEHLANVIKSKQDNKMYGTIKGELLKFFENCNSVYEWIVDTSQGSNLKHEAGVEEEAAGPKEATTAESESLQDVEVSIDNQKIIAALMLAKSQKAEEASPEDGLIKALRGKCKIGDVHSEFEDPDSFSYHELQRRLTSDYVLLSRRFTREINVLFGITNEICLRKIRFNKTDCDCEVCKGE